MNKINTNAIRFYNDLLEKDIVEKNEEIRDCLIEVSNWQQTFTKLIKNAHHFKFKILEKEKMIQLAKDYKFETEFINRLIS